MSIAAPETPLPARSVATGSGKWNLSLTNRPQLDGCGTSTRAGGADVRIRCSSSSACEPSGVPLSDPGVDPQALLTALTTEHFTLQGARSSTISESTARAALFVGALSSALIALGFIGDATNLGSSFDVFVLVVLPTLYLLGVFTFVRLVESSIEDLFYGRAINRIRSYYLQMAGAQARYFALDAHDDVFGVLANMGVTRPSRWQLYFTLASMIAVLNAVVGGAVVAFLAGVLGAPLGLATPLGGLAALASLAVSIRWQSKRHVEARESGEPLSPS